MLTTLLESKSRHSRDRRGAALSVIVHSVLIFGAVYATASGSPAPEPEQRIHSFPLVIVQRPQTKAVRTPTPPKTSARPAPRTITIPIEIPTSIPKIDVSASPITPGDFVPLVRGASSAGDTGSTAVESGRRAYQDFEVESPVAAIGVVSPEYPSALRSSGVEGHVTAQFIVNERGRFEESSLEILSSTNALFVESIRRALPRMRFRPAKIGDRAVPQLVRQDFSFVLDH